MNCCTYIGTAARCQVPRPRRCGGYRCDGPSGVAGDVSIPRASYENILNRIERMRLNAFRAGLRGHDYWAACWKILGLVQESDRLLVRHPMPYIASRRKGPFRVIFNRHDGLHWVRLPF